MDIFELLLLAVGLAMDAFAVSICKGLAARKVTMKEFLACGLWFGIFQAGMPFVGYLVGSRFEKWISVIAPWMAFVLLTLIGGNMIKEALGPEEEVTPGFDVKTMFMMAVATSIDALAVGITFVAMPVKVISGGNLVNVAIAVSIIGIITCFISMAGVKIGSVFGMRYKSGSEIMGGTILIFLGLRSLITYLDKAQTLSDADTIFGMLIPLAGTVLGAGFAYSKANKIPEELRVILAGTSAGIMFSMSAWGMIEPAIRGLSDGGRNGIIYVVACFCGGVAVQYLLDSVVPHTHAYADLTEGPESKLKPDVKLMLAEVIHHVPEGIALGAIFAGHFMKTDWIPASSAFVLAIAIAIQNFPEALFVSLPVKERGGEPGKAFLMGIISGGPVPLLGIFTVILAVLFPAALPYVCAVAGGAMIYTTVEEIPQIATKKDNDKGTLAFVIGFALVMLETYLNSGWLAVAPF